MKSVISIEPEAPSMADARAVASFGNPKLHEPIESVVPAGIGSTARGPPPLATPRLALSIPEFCEAHGISEGLFYKLKRQGEGPREMKVGRRTLISVEAAADWRRAREAE